MPMPESSELYQALAAAKKPPMLPPSQDPVAAMHAAAAAPTINPATQPVSMPPAGPPAGGSPQVDPDKWRQFQEANKARSGG